MFSKLIFKQHETGCNVWFYYSYYIYIIASYNMKAQKKTEILLFDSPAVVIFTTCVQQKNKYIWKSDVVD